MKMTAAGSSPTIQLNSAVAQDLRGTVDLAFDKDATGGGTYGSFLVRRTGTGTTGSDYRAKVLLVAGGSLKLYISKIVGGTETVLGSVAIAGVTYVVGDKLRLSFDLTGGATGTTTLSAKLWKVGATEPAAFQLVKTDATASLQAAGGVGLAAYLSGSSTQAPAVATFDNLSVTAK